MSRRSAVLLIILAMLASCRTRPTRSSREIVVWRNLGSWSARGSSQTEAFTSDTGMLRVRWEARNEDAHGPDGRTGTLRVTVHSAVSGRPLVAAVNHAGAGQDTVYVNEDPREFYLVVDSQHLEWKVAVDEGIPATMAEPERR